MESKPKRGRKKIYDGEVEGAPRLITRVDPDVLEWAKSRPEGVRKYVERLIRTDRGTTGAEAQEGLPKPS